MAQQEYLIFDPSSKSFIIFIFYESCQKYNTNILFLLPTSSETKLMDKSVFYQKVGPTLSQLTILNSEMICNNHISFAVLGQAEASAYLQVNSGSQGLASVFFGKTKFHMIFLTNFLPLQVTGFNLTLSLFWC